MKILVTPRSFGIENPQLFARLRDAGCEVIRNQTGAVLDKEAMLNLLAPCEGVIVGIDPLDRDVLAAAPGLKVISKYGVGIDNIDLEECEKRGIKVFRTVGANSNAVADYAFALMLGVARRIVDTDRRCRNGDWRKTAAIDVYGKTLGIIGLGAIGKCVARRAKGFEMRVLAADESWDENFAAEHNIVRRDIGALCAEADFISLHCSLTPATRNIINADIIAGMKPTAVLINTARGELVSEDALLEALQQKRIWGAGIDVFREEPPATDAWSKLDNVILGSHCAASTRGAVAMMGAMAVDNLLNGLGL